MLTICHNYFCVLPNSKSNKDGNQQSSKKKYLFGLFLLLLVDVLWVVSSELTKYIYTENKLERPFLVTYVRSSLLFVYLLVLCFTPPTRDPCRPPDYTQLLEPSADTDDGNYYSDSGNSLGDSTFVPVRAGETTDSDDAVPRAVRFNKVAEVRVMSAAQASEALLARLSWSASLRASQHAERRAAAAATRRHLRLALFICFPWFISNYLYHVSLVHLSTSSATVYTSAAGAVVVSLGAMLTPTTNEKFTVSKFVGILFTTTSFVILGVCEGGSGGWRGPVAALGASVGYACHLLMLRTELRKGDGINSPLLVGLVGSTCAGLAWAAGGALAACGVERVELPPAVAWSWLLLDATLAPLLLESLWLWGQSLTSPATATAMLSLALPVAACTGWRGTPAGETVWRGAAALVAAIGWLLAALDPPLSLPALTHFTHTLRPTRGFTTLRNISDLDEQTEALMSCEEPT